MFEFLARFKPFRKDPKLEWLDRIEKSLKFIQKLAEVGIQKLIGPMSLDRKSRLDFFLETKKQIDELLPFVELLKNDQENQVLEFHHRLEQICSYLTEQTRDLLPMEKVPPPPGVENPNRLMDIPIMHQGIIREELKNLLTLRDSFPYSRPS